MIKKYIKLLEGAYSEYDVSSDLYAKLLNLPEDRRPEFLPASDLGVQAWLAGKSAPKLVAVITARQGRQYLIANNLIDKVAIAIESIEDDMQKKIALNYWEYSTEFQLDNPVLIAIAGALELNQEQLKEMFRDASKL